MHARGHKPLATRSRHLLQHVLLLLHSSRGVLALSMPPRLTHTLRTAYTWQVYRPTGWTLRTLAAVNGFMLLVCLGAVVGSVQSLINQWSTFQFFA